MAETTDVRLARIEETLKAIRDNTDNIYKQTQRTNGRVDALEESTKDFAKTADLKVVNDKVDKIGISDASRKVWVVFLWLTLGALFTLICGSYLYTFDHIKGDRLTDPSQVQFPK